MYKLTTLKNKLKVITYNIPNAHGVTTGIFVNVGSRYETDKIAGVSHFIEHMLFKGTQTRPTPADISRVIERIGGYLNAATSQDYTFYYNRVPCKHAAVALEVLADMFNNSLFDAGAIKRESGVILEELNMYLDTPTRYLYDLIMQTIWPGSALGRDVIGTRQSIKGLRQQDFLKYLANTYQPQNLVVVATGKVNHSQTVKAATKYFGNLKNKTTLKFKFNNSQQTQPRVNIYNKKTDQVHLCLAVPALPRNHKDEAILTLLDTILGTGMSSRLFLNIREKRGLCYSINSFNEKFHETGLFGITAGLSLNKIDLAIRAIVFELEQLTQTPVSSTELAEAKEYLRGSISLRSDNTDNMTMWYGAQGLFAKNIKTPEQKIKELLDITENDIMKLAQQLFNRNRLNLAIIGPFSSKDKSRFLKLIK